MVETMVVVCALAIGGRAMEMVAVVPPIMKPRRVVLIFDVPVGRLLIMTSADARCGISWKVCAKLSTMLQAMCHAGPAGLNASRRARVQRGGGNVDCGARAGPRFRQPD